MSQVSKLFAGSDHAGLSLKKELLAQLGVEFPSLHIEDCGTHAEESTDYPQFARIVAQNVVKHAARGILICGSGIGMCIAANKVSGIRAAMAWDVTSARLSRRHNDSNILCLGARLVGQEVALEVLRTWLVTSFEGGRHQNRIDLISKMEKEGT